MEKDILINFKFVRANSSHSQVESNNLPNSQLENDKYVHLPFWFCNNHNLAISACVFGNTKFTLPSEESDEPFDIEYLFSPEGNPNKKSK